MRTPALWSLVAAVVSVVVSGTAAAQELTTPAEWRWRLERPARLVTGQDVPDSAWRFVGMPPGWHVTTGPAVVLYHPGEHAAGRYSLSASFVLFPGQSDAPFGLVLGGADLATATTAQLAVQLRRDGAVRVVSQRDRGVTELAPWRTHPAIRVQAGSEVVTNRLRVAVGADSMRVFVNDTAVTAVAAAGLATDGQFGLQVGERLNLHITTLDYTRHLAPGRAP